ncbi:MAG: hypothetical protein QOG62_396 [Thermoleophilaceae bacterium]|nr:hypothetical protein [Thermoleophilaceae bacterium]
MTRDRIVWRPAPSGLVALVLVLGIAGSATAAPAQTTLVSRATGPSGAKAAMNAEVGPESISDDGRFVVFSTSAANLDPADSGPPGQFDDDDSDVYVRDVVNDKTVLVSRATGFSGAKGNSSSDSATISGTGRYIAFISNATNLDPADTDGYDDVFVRDMATGETTLASVATDGTKSDFLNYDVSISDDGNFVAFSSLAGSLSPDDASPPPDQDWDIYVRNLKTGQTRLVSRADGPEGAKGNSDSGTPSISGDGRFVAFDSGAANLDPDDTSADGDVYVRDLLADDTILASRADGGVGQSADGNAQEAVIDRDGGRVLFSARATNLGESTGAGRFLAYVRDLRENTTTVASRADGPLGAVADGPSFASGISADGQSVAFLSHAANLNPLDTDLVYDVYVRNLATATTTLASRASGIDGPKGRFDSLAPSLSADGSVVDFFSISPNLVPGDNGNNQFGLGSDEDVFVRDLRTPALGSCHGEPVTLAGTDGGERLEGTDDADVIAGLGGPDHIKGGGGDDVICAGAGSDRAGGGAGRDVLLGQAGADTLRGGADKDRLTGGKGRDTCSGQSGRDRARACEKERGIP